MLIYAFRPLQHRRFPPCITVGRAETRSAVRLEKADVTDTLG